MGKRDKSAMDIPAALSLPVGIATGIAAFFGIRYGLPASTPALVAAGAEGITASIPAQANWTVAWSITDGQITSIGGPNGVTASGSNSITFTAGTPGTLNLSVTVTGLDQSVGIGQAQD